MPELTEEELQKAREELDEWAELLSITTTPFFEKFIHRPEKTVALFTGNQWGKNVNIIKQYILRWMGRHPIEAKNLRPDTKIRTYRFCSETVPFDPTGEDSNTIYPVLKRLLPAKFILEDVNQRRNTMTIKDFQGGPNFYIEFSSYNQTICGAGKVCPRHSLDCKFISCDGLRVSGRLCVANTDSCSVVLTVVQCLV